MDSHLPHCTVCMKSLTAGWRCPEHSSNLMADDATTQKMPWFEKAIRDHADEFGPSGGAWNISMILERLHRSAQASPLKLLELAAQVEKLAKREHSFQPSIQAILHQHRPRGLSGRDWDDRAAFAQAITLVDLAPTIAAALRAKEQN